MNRLFPGNLEGKQLAVGGHRTGRPAVSNCLNGRLCSLALAVAGALSTPNARACAACFGRSDDALAKGMNLGILALLGVTVTVLLALGTFGVFLARRSAAKPPGATPASASPGKP